jgi:hypothetical protein
VDGEIDQTLYSYYGGTQSEKQSKFTVFVNGCSWLIETTDHDKAGKPLSARETGCTNGTVIYEVGKSLKSFGTPGAGSIWNIASVVFHIVLLTDHLPLVFPGLFIFLNAIFSPLGYFSVAEGFVFLSGFVSGLVYTRVGRAYGQRAVWRKALGRARNIYLCYVAAVVALLVLAKCVNSNLLEWGAWGDLADQSLPVAAAKVATLLYQPTFLEILPMYALFLLFMPIMLNQLEKRNYLLVGLISFLTWLSAQFGLRDELVKLVPSSLGAHFGYFNSLAWQILFFSGLICGHKTYTADGSWLPAGWTLPVLAYILALAFFAFRHDLWGIRLNERWVGRSNLGPLRLLNMACLIFLVCKARGQIEKLIAWKGFAFLSKHSLQVFAFHLFPLYFVAIAFGTRMSVPTWAQVIAMGFGILGLFQIAFVSQLVKARFAR